MILLFSDIHADKKSAKDIERIAKCFERIYCAGDICGYGKDFKYCIDMFKELEIKSVIGNHDRLVINNEDLSIYSDLVAKPIAYTRKHIKEKELDYLKNLPESIKDNNIFVIHTIDSDRYIRSDIEAKDLLGMTSTKFILIGHTHVPAKYEFGNRYIINLGSITKGRIGSPRGYVIIDGEEIRFVQLDKVNLGDVI